MAIFWKESHIECILAYFGDSQYTVKIDRLRSGEIRYLCWRKSNSILSRPNLILRNGEVKKGPKQQVEYTFKHGECVFSVEGIASDQAGGAHFYFVEVTDADNKKSTWKMEQMPIPKYFRYLI